MFGYAGTRVSSVQFSLGRTFILSALTAKTVMSAQSNHARRLNRTATFSVCVGILRVSGLHHGTIEVVSSSLLTPTLQNCVVRTLTFWFAGRPDHRGLRNVGSYDQRHWKLVCASPQGTMGPCREGTCRRLYTVCRPLFDGWAASEGKKGKDKGSHKTHTAAAATL